MAGSERGRAYAVAFLVYALAVGEGYDFGVFATVLVRLDETFVISDSMLGLLGACHFLGMIAGAPLSGPLADSVGRKLSLSFACIFLVAGSLIMGMATSVPVVLAGRMVMGFGFGFGVPLGSLYIVEMSPAQLRGTLGAGFGACLAVGNATGGILGALLQDTWQDWRVMTLLGAVLPSIVMIALPMPWFPESPRWLVAQGRLEDARTALLLLGGSDPDATVAEIKEELLASGSSGRSTWDVAKAMMSPDPQIRPRVLAAVGCMCALFLSGVVSLIIYLPLILKADFERRRAVQIAGAVSSCSALLGLLCVRLPDIFGRRNLLMDGYLAIAIGWGQLCFAMSGYGLPPGAIRGWYLVVWFTILIFAFQICVAPVTLFYPGEVLPSDLRAVGLGLANASSRVCGFCVTMSLPILLDYSTVMAYATMATLNAGLVGFVFSRLRETKGLDLERMAEAFACRTK